MWLHLERLYGANAMLNVVSISQQNNSNSNKIIVNYKQVSLNRWTQNKWGEEVKSNDRLEIQRREIHNSIDSIEDTDVG